MPAEKVFFVNSEWKNAKTGTEIVSGVIIGLNAFASIQEAVDAADVSTGAVTIQVAAGTYHGNVVLKDKNNLIFNNGKEIGRVHFIAEKGKQVIMDGSFTLGDDPIQLQDISDIEINGFTFTNVPSPVYILSSNTAGRNIILANNTIAYSDKQATQGAFYVNSRELSGVIVTGNTITGVVGQSMSIGSCTGTINNILVSDNTITHSAAGASTPIQMTGAFGNTIADTAEIGLFGQILPDGVLIANNIFTDSSCALWHQNLEADSPGKITISGNIFINGIGLMFGFRTNAEKSDFVIGSGNTVDGEEITGWANIADDQLIVSPNAAAGNVLYYDHLLYLGKKTAFSSALDACNAASADGKIVLPGKNPVMVNVSDVHFETLMVNGAWRTDGKMSDGDAMVIGGKRYYLGINAFGTMDEAIANMDETTVEISLQGNTTLGNTTEMYIKHDLMIRGNGHTIDRIVSSTRRLYLDILSSDRYDLTYKVIFDNVRFNSFPSNQSGAIYFDTDCELVHDTRFQCCQYYSNTGVLALDETSGINIITLNGSVDDETTVTEKILRVSGMTAPK